MKSAKGKWFANKLGCPSAQALLPFGTGSRTSAQDVASHLALCGFCDAELHFLSRHQPLIVRHEHAERLQQIRLTAEARLTTRSDGTGDPFRASGW
jgi:hypothetical protein